MDILHYDYDRVTVENSLKLNSERTERALREFFYTKSEQGSLKTIKEAQCYSLLGGGKRIRPYLVNEVCRMFGGNEEVSMQFAIAVEMIHTYSLIHDDLPCMDDDDMRRGRPTNHKMFGEANAVLAGDALLTNAFLALSSNKYASAEAIAEAVALASDAAGDMGMIGGQVTDIEGETKEMTFEELLTLHSLKTGKLIELSAALGAISAGFGRDTPEFFAVCAYARKVGLAFQVVDDLLDVLGDEATVGKTLASDAENEKTTFLTFFDIKGAKAYAKRLTYDAISGISALNGSETLQALALYLLDRNS